MKRLMTILMATAGLTLICAPAFAHSRLISTIPAGGAMVTTLLPEVVMEFNEPIEAAFGGVQIFDAAGVRIPVGEPQITGKTVKVALTPQPPAGDYTVAFRIISGDSHPVESRFAFNYNPPAPVVSATAVPAEPAGVPAVGAQAEPDAAESKSFWGQYKFIVIAAVLFLLVAVVVMRPGAKDSELATE